MNSSACLLVEDVDSVEENGRTPLMYSAMAGHENCLKLLLKKHAHLSARDSNGQTALHWAAVSVSVLKYVYLQVFILNYTCSIIILLLHAFRRVIWVV